MSRVILKQVNLHADFWHGTAAERSASAKKAAENSVERRKKYEKLTRGFQWLKLCGY